MALNSVQKPDAFFNFVFLGFFKILGVICLVAITDILINGVWRKMLKLRILILILFHSLFLIGCAIELLGWIKMYKYLITLIAIIAMAINGSALTDSQVIYSDVIMYVYNNTCIETSNWLYLHVNNAEDMRSNLDIGNFEGVKILVHEIEQIGNKSVLADICY